jgi:hypothetical protein
MMHVINVVIGSTLMLVIIVGAVAYTNFNFRSLARFPFLVVKTYTITHHSYKYIDLGLHNYDHQWCVSYLGRVDTLQRFPNQTRLFGKEWVDKRSHSC